MATLTPPDGWRFAWLDEIAIGTSFRYHADDWKDRVVDRRTNQSHSMVLVPVPCSSCNGSGRAAAGSPPPTPAWQGIFDAQQAKVDRQKVYDDVFSELSMVEGFDGTDDAEHDRLHDLTERILALTSPPPTPAPEVDQ